MNHLVMVSGLLLALACAAPAAIAAAGGPAESPARTNGEFLTDLRGRTLYAFALDGPDASTCMGACARTWPPFIARRARSPHPDYKIIRRQDGRAQWSFRGQPLYYFIGDRAPGQVKATDANWSAIDPDLAAQRTAER